jgi:hypothetical protein
MARTSQQIEDNIVNSILGEGSEFKASLPVNVCCALTVASKEPSRPTGRTYRTERRGHYRHPRQGGVIGAWSGATSSQPSGSHARNGRLYGKILTPSLVLEDGVIFDGNSVIKQEPRSCGGCGSTSGHYGENV